MIAEVLAALSAGRWVAIIGGADDLERMVGDVFDLKRGTAASSPELFGFNSWQEVVAFAQTEEGEDLRTFVQLVEKHGESALWAAIKGVQQTEERDAEVTISTAHKAKGREWTSVHLTNDFLSARMQRGAKDAESEVRLFYVAMTRAKQYLSVDTSLVDGFVNWHPRKPAAVRPKVPPAQPTAKPFWRRLLGLE